MKPIKPSAKTQPSAPVTSAGRKTTAACGKNSARALLIAAFLTAGTFSSSAAIINVPSGQPTITAALAAAVASDQIVIASGTYAEAAMLNVNKSVTLTASGGLVTVNVPVGASSVASVSAAGVVFSGIKFERLTANNDWMRSVEMGSGSATFTNCTFTGPGNGVGVVLFSGADATFDNCAFSNFNATASWAAAIFMQNQGAGYSDVIVRNCTFDTGCNGWIKAFDNSASWARVGELTVSNCTFKAARSTTALKFRDGGASAMQYDPTKALLFQDCTFEGTTLEMAEFHYTGGSRPTSLKFSRCEFKAYNSTRKIFWLDLPTPIVFEDCLFAGGQHQTIMTVWGGPPSVNFYHCTMINDGYAGGTPQSSFINGWDGGRTFNIVNCLFRCPVNYTAGFVGDAGSSANRNYAVSNSIIDHATPVGAKAQITAGPGYSNASLAAAFVNPAGRNYRLLNGSPWVDGGIDLGYTLDLDRNARNHGSAPDMGAYELNRPPVASAISMGCALGQAVSLQVIGAPKHAPVDADGDSMTVTAAGAADSGISGFTATSVTYNANGTPGTHSFSYTVTDALGATDTKTVTVSVSAAEGFNKLSGPTPLGGGLYQLGYLGIPGEKYALDETSSLTPPITWTPVITNTASGLGAIGFTFTPVNPSGYFRTRYVP